MLVTRKGVSRGGGLDWLRVFLCPARRWPERAANLHTDGPQPIRVSRDYLETYMRQEEGPMTRLLCFG